MCSDQGAGTGLIRRGADRDHDAAAMKNGCRFRRVRSRRQEFAEQAAFMMRIGIPAFRRMFMPILMRMPAAGSGNGIFCSVGIKQEMQIGEQHHQKAVEPT